MTNRKLMLVALALTTLSLTACENTLYGAGQDVENAGENIQETAAGQ